MNMARSSDPMFLFEIVVEDLKSFIDCKEFIIKSQFADVFTLDLDDINESREVLTQTDRKRKCKKKTKVRKSSFIEKQAKFPNKKVKMGSIILAYNIDKLISNMKNYPMELSLWSKKSHKVIGSNNIPWSLNHIDYLKSVIEQKDPCPVAVDGQYNVFHEFTSKRMATVKLNVKLSYLKKKVTAQFQSLFKQHSFDPLTKITSRAKKRTINRTDKVGVIKAYDSKRIIKTVNCHQINSDAKPHMAIEKEKSDFHATIHEIDNNFKTPRRCIYFTKSDTTIDNNKKLDLVESKSLSIINRKQPNTLNYIFGDTCPYGNQVYCVGYFTVENDFAKGTGSSTSDNSLEKQSNFKKSGSTSCIESVGSFGLHLSDVSIKKCEIVECNLKNYRDLPEKPDDRILFDLTNLKKECCNVTEKLENVVGGMTANMTFGKDSCMCTCECKFGFTKRTTYCTTCGGYKKSEDMARKAGHEMPFPCPIYHNIPKGKAKVLSISDKKSVSDKQSKKEVNRFKFNYGYEGIPPKIGHSHCGFPCTGTLGVVPKNMGWLWNAGDIPGMKFRPMWKPGAISKYVVRLLKMAKNPGQLQRKKRRRDMGKKTRSLKRPLLTVHKKDGEFSVTMETMKVYSKPRSFNQYPYEDKPVLTYTIGRTEEENRQRQKKKERNQRRLERAQRQFIQSTFRDMCQEICLKTYRQALGILPDTEDPDCLCYPAEPGADRTNMDVSCSCSEDKSTSGSDTDLDEWIVEFTPPNATFLPTYKGKKVLKIDNCTQYTYLDYKVKKLDIRGNPVPRFFKGPDGTEQCSDLGGFWSPNKKWLDINVDGYIGPDERWAPMTFIGPSGETVECETGKFQATNGVWLTVGIDGYIDSQGNWKCYPRPRPKMVVKQTRRTKSKKNTDQKNDKMMSHKSSEAAWSCLGDATPRALSKMGILGHGHDRKLLLDTLKAMLAQGQDVRIPVQSTVPSLPGSKRSKKRTIYSPQYYNKRTKCKHSTPSEKGIIATDELGNKTYFRLKDYQNRRPQERLTHLTEQGISLNSFHLPCFRSFINNEIMKKELYAKLQARYGASK